jgi:hypothetical protein
MLIIVSGGEPHRKISFSCGKQKAYLQATIHCFFPPVVSLFASKGQLHVLPSEIISEPKLFPLKNQKLTAFSLFQSKMAARSAFLCQPVGFVPQKYG